MGLPLPKTWDTTLPNAAGSLWEPLCGFFWGKSPASWASWPCLSTLSTTGKMVPSVFRGILLPWPSPARQPEQEPSSRSQWPLKL